MSRGVLNGKVDRLFKEGRLVRFRKGELIARAGDRPDGVFLIRTGHLKAYSISNEGDERILLTCGPGSVFPLDWIFNDTDYDYYLEALDVVTLHRLSKNSFLEPLKTNTELLFIIAGYLSSLSLQHLERIKNLEYTTATERLAHYLQLMAEHFGKPVGRNNTIIDAPLTHQHIANSINLARETVSRELEQLQRSKVIGYQRRHIVITSQTYFDNLLG